MILQLQSFFVREKINVIDYFPKRGQTHNLHTNNLFHFVYGNFKYLEINLWKVIDVGKHVYPR